MAVEVRDSSPVMGETYYRIYYSDALTMYESRYMYDSSVKQYHVDSNTMKMYSEDTLLLHEWRNQFFIFHQDSSYGVSYAPYSETNNRRLRVDSEVARIAGTNNLDSLLAVKADTSVWSANNTELREVYNLPKRIDMPDGHITLFYSSKLNHLKNSLDKAIDSAKKMKLFRMEYILNEYYSEQQKRNWSAMKGITEMRTITISNSEEIYSYFNRYKKR